MRKLGYILVPLLLTLLLFSACSVNGKTDPEEYIDGTWAGYFKSYWHAMNDNYVFWDIDSPEGEWDEVYETYLSQFEALGDIEGTYTSGGSDEAAVSLFYEIIENNISDHHYVMVFYCTKMETTSGTYAYPAIYRRIQDYFTSETKETNYWAYYLEQTISEDFDQTEYYCYSDITDLWEKDFGLDLSSSSAGGTSGPDLPGPPDQRSEAEAVSATYYLTTNTITESDSASSGGIYTLSDYKYGYNELTSSSGSTSYTMNILVGYIGSTLYLSFDRFYINTYSSLSSASSPAVVQVFDYFLEELANSPDVIIDMRGNGGGDNADLPLFWGDFVSSDTQYGYYYTKTGDNRLAYGSRLPAYLYSSGDSDYTGEIRVLISDYTASNGDKTAMLFKALEEYYGWDNVKLIGSNTAGALGCISSIYDAGSLYYSGQYYIYTPSVQYRYLDGKSYEGVGISPSENYSVVFDYSSWSSSDPVLSAAINSI